MRKILMVTLVLACASWLQAQDAGKMGQDAGKMDAGKMGMVTVQGCLQYAKHHYTVVDKDGNQHRLIGYANKLKAHVGHTVEITGKETTHSESTTMEGTASTAHQAPAIQVSGVKHIADTCKAGM